MVDGGRGLASWEQGGCSTDGRWGDGLINLLYEPLFSDAEKAIKKRTLRWLRLYSFAL